MRGGVCLESGNASEFYRKICASLELESWEFPWRIVSMGVYCMSRRCYEILRVYLDEKVLGKGVVGRISIGIISRGWKSD